MSEAKLVEKVLTSHKEKTENESERKSKRPDFKKISSAKDVTYEDLVIDWESGRPWCFTELISHHDIIRSESITLCSYDDGYNEVVVEPNFLSLSIRDLENLNDTQKERLRILANEEIIEKQKKEKDSYEKVMVYGFIAFIILIAIFS